MSAPGRLVAQQARRSADAAACARTVGALAFLSRDTPACVRPYDLRTRKRLDARARTRGAIAPAASRGASGRLSASMLSSLSGRLNLRRRRVPARLGHFRPLGEAAASDAPQPPKDVAGNEIDRMVKRG